MFRPTTVLLSAALLLAASAIDAQELVVPDVATPQLPMHAGAVSDFVPRGWTIETRFDGPVDSDGKPDVVLLLRDADPRNVLHNEGLGVGELDTNPRMLVVLAADLAGGFRRLAQSDTLIRRNDTPTLEDALEEGGGISLTDRKLTVSVGFFANAGSWTMSTTRYTFRWQDGCMRLIGYDEQATQRNSGDITNTSVNLLTGSRTLKSGNIANDHDRVRHQRAKPVAPVCLEAVSAEFSP